MPAACGRLPPSAIGLLSTVKIPPPETLQPMAQCFGRHANPKQKGSAETKHCSKNLREEVSEQHPARHSLLGSAGRCCFALSRIRRFRFAVFLEAAWRYCAVNTILAHRPPRCNDRPPGWRNRVGLVSTGIRGMSGRVSPGSEPCGVKSARAGSWRLGRASCRRAWHRPGELAKHAVHTACRGR